MGRSRHELLGVLGLAAALVAALPAPLGAWQGELVLHKEGSGLYHRPGCPVVRDSAGILALSRAQAEARGYKPHPECDPSNPRAVPPAKSAPTIPPAPITVFVDGPKYYHRKSCPKLDASSSSLKAVTLEAAAKTHWPCPACKPPIFKRNTEPAVPGTNRRRGR